MFLNITRKCVQLVYQNVYLILCQNVYIIIFILITINKRVVYVKDWFDAGIRPVILLLTKLKSYFEMSAQLFLHMGMSLVL